MIALVRSKYNVNVIGSGSRTIIFAHGLGMDQTSWRLLTPFFKDDFKIILFDYSGCGSSDKLQYQAENYVGLSDYARDLIQLCDAYQIADAVFVGHSVSCMIGLLAAISKPSLFNEMIFIGPSPRYINDTDGYYGGFQKNDVENLIRYIDEDYAGWIKTSLPAVIKNEDNRQVVEEIQQIFVSNDSKMLRQFALATFFSDHRSQLLSFENRCLIIQTNDDLMAPIQVGDYMSAHLRNSEMVVLKNKGHFPQLTAPHELVRIIKNYLKGEVVEL